MVEAPITVNVAYDPESDVWYVKASSLAEPEQRLSISLSTNYPAPLPIFLKKAADFAIRIFDKPCHASAMPSRGVKRLRHRCPRFSYRRPRPELILSRPAERSHSYDRMDPIS